MKALAERRPRATQRSGGGDAPPWKDAVLPHAVCGADCWPPSGTIFAITLATPEGAVLQRGGHRPLDRPGREALCLLPAVTGTSGSTPIGLCSLTGSTPPDVGTGAQHYGKPCRTPHVDLSLNPHSLPGGGNSQPRGPRGRGSPNAPPVMQLRQRGAGGGGGPVLTQATQARGSGEPVRSRGHTACTQPVSEVLSDLGLCRGRGAPAWVVLPLWPVQFQQAAGVQGGH